MFHTFRDLRGFSVRAEDEPKGTVDDLYFDDQTWGVRYLVVDVGFWVFGRQSLIGRDLLQEADLERRELPVSLTADQIKEAPRPEADPPVSEQQQILQRRAGDRWPTFVLGAAGAAYSPILAEEQIRQIHNEPETRQSGDPHLRSMEEVTGYYVAATDGEIGTVSDFLINPLDWKVRYLVIDTGTWLPGRKVVVATGWVAEVDWSQGRLAVDVTRHQVETSPEFDEVAGLQRTDEEAIFGHYGLPGYWAA